MAIAARIDAFGGKYMGDTLKADIGNRLDEIREKYKEPPPPKEPKTVPKRRRQRPRRREPGRRDKKRRKNRRARQG